MLGLSAGKAGLGSLVGASEVWVRLRLSGEFMGFPRNIYT